MADCLSDMLDSFVRQEMPDRKQLRFVDLDTIHTLTAVNRAVEISKNLLVSDGPRCIIMNTESTVVILVCCGPNPDMDDLESWVANTVSNITKPDSNVESVVFVYWASEFHLGFYVKARNGSSEVAARVQAAVDKTVAETDGGKRVFSQDRSQLN